MPKKTKYVVEFELPAFVDESHVLERMQDVVWQLALDSEVSDRELNETDIMNSVSVIAPVTAKK